MKYMHFLSQIITSLILAACASATPVTEIPPTESGTDSIGTVDQSPLTPFLETPLTGEKPTTTPTDSLLPSPSPAITFTPTPSPVQTSTQTLVSQPSDFDLAFSSNQDGEFAIYLMDPNNPSRWMKLERPRDYERIMWPSFCGSRIAAEVKDMDNEKRQWIYLISPEGYSEEWNPPGSPDQLGIPRCSTNGDFMSYTAFEEGKWVHTVADTSGDNRLMTDNTGLGISGYGSWFANDRDHLWMVQDGDIWIILMTKDLQISNTLQLLPRETTSGEMIDQWRHPAISPDGTQYAFNCLIGDSSYICIADMDSNRARTLRKIVREDVGVWVSVNPVWSKDGRWIYFNSAEDGDWDIYRMSPDGTDLENLTDTWNSIEFHPATRW